MREVFYDLFTPRCRAFAIYTLEIDTRVRQIQLDEIQCMCPTRKNDTIQEH
jgi:hypothetical protein